MSLNIIAHIDMDAFFAAVEVRDNPALKGKPVVVGADPKAGKGRGVVSTCSYEARRYGIHSAMPISMAYQRCPQAIFLPVNMRKYSDVSERIFNILYNFTPDIEPLSIDEAFMDLTGSRALFGTPLEMGTKIKQQIKQELRLAASIGIAPNKMTAKIASTLSKPDGLLEVTPENLLSFLWPLAVSKMFGVGEQTQRILTAMNIHTIGDLAKESEASLFRQLGPRGRYLWDLANGRDARKVICSEPAKSVGHEHTFEEDTSNREEITAVLSVLCEKVSHRLRREGLRGKTVTLKLRFSDFKTITRDFTLAQRTNFFDVIYKTTKSLLNESFLSGRKYRLVGVRVTNFNQPYVRESLFEETDVGGAKAEKIHKAVDAIKVKFGERGIVRGESQVRSRTDP